METGNLKTEVRFGLFHVAEAGQDRGALHHSRQPPSRSLLIKLNL
jgi:hypothetical protein